MALAAEQKRRLEELKSDLATDSILAVDASFRADMGIQPYTELTDDQQQEYNKRLADEVKRRNETLTNLVSQGISFKDMLGEGIPISILLDAEVALDMIAEGITLRDMVQGLPAKEIVDQSLLIMLLAQGITSKEIVESGLVSDLLSQGIPINELLCQGINSLDLIEAGFLPKPTEPEAPANKGKGRKKKGTTKSHKVLSIHAKRNAFAVKCYEEQLPNGEQFLYDNIKQINRSFSGIFVIAIKHYKDTITEGIWEVSTEKKHYHVIVKFADYKVSQRIITVLNALGIVFRQGKDDSLIENHGIESIGDWCAYVVYLTHETDDAIADGKEIYDHSELVSNLSEEQIQEFRDRYFGAKKVKPKEMADLDREAYALGYVLGDYSVWYDNLLYDARKQGGMKTIAESYHRGVTKYVAEHNEVLRLCVFIQGKHEVGKTYNTQKALEKIFPKDLIYHVKHGGTGQFDRFQSHMRAIVVDDFALRNILNVTDNYACQLERRNCDNPWWLGTHLIVTSNYSFPEWLEEKCLFRIKDKYGRVSETYNAIKSRFYICHIGVNENGRNELVLDSSSTRGTLEEIKKRDLMFQEFQNNFNTSISNYTPCVKNQTQEIDVSDLALTPQEMQKFSAYIKHYKEMKISANEELKALYNEYKQLIEQRSFAYARVREEALNRPQSEWGSYYDDCKKIEQESYEEIHSAWQKYSDKQTEIEASVLKEFESMNSDYRRTRPFP